MKLLFMGSDPISIPLLDSVLKEESIELIAIYTQPDRASGRGKKIQPNAIKDWALKHQIPIKQPQKPDQEDVDWIVENQIDCTLVMAYGHLLKQNLLDAAKKETLNIHASLLPKYRGASPIETSIANGDSKTGVTLMRITKKMDSGPLIDQESVSISSEDTGLTVREKISHACIPLMKRNWRAIENRQIHLTEQDEDQVTYCRKLTKLDAGLDFKMPAKLLAAKIRAFAHWPKCEFVYSGMSIKTSMASVQECEAPQEPGTILSTDKQGLHISSGKGILIFHKLQKPGGKMLMANDFLRGFKIPENTRIDNAPSPDLVSDIPF
jgi:methionyl-tRNA formyltransferase